MNVHRLRPYLLAAARPNRRPDVAAYLDSFSKWLTFVNFAGVGQTYQQRVRSLGGLNKALMKWEVMQ
jgi:hypothetical protein